PVLSRGETPPGADADHGVIAEPGLEPFYPTLAGVDLAAGKDDPARKVRPPGVPVFEPGEKVRLAGGKLRAGQPVRVVLTPPAGGDAIELVPPDAAGGDTRLDVALQSADPVARPLRAGFFAVAVKVRTGDVNNPERATNELPLLVAPKVAAVVPSLPVVNGAIPANSTLTVTFAPAVRDRQRVVLLV